ncbi:unnamed protein product [Lactuca virosa]|uniref:PPM-type phosphatase domain-containing protein n=1 Tax=Lactuca virosa TaxID=75947 RepID=A0AAU9ML01_9ASTR|nr:unnamed protein product [Lactuca virosa]
MGFRKLQGAREEMEDDAVIVCSSPHNDLDGFFFAAVFDGHTGFSSVNFLSNMLSTSDTDRKQPAVVSVTKHTLEIGIKRLRL